MQKIDEKKPFFLKRYLSEKIGNIIVPFCNMYFLPRHQFIYFFLEDFPLSWFFLDTKTQDGVMLDTLELMHPDQEKLAPENQQYVIYLNGNGMFYGSNIDEAQAHILQERYNAVLFSYRGTGGEGVAPKSADDLVQDGIAQVQRLLDKGVLSTNIVLKGLSLGGGVGAKVGEYFHAQGKPIYVYNERSFSTTTNVAVTLLREIPYVGKTLGFLLYPIVWGVMNYSGWEMNAAKAFKSIPKEYRDYAVVRTPKAKRTAKTLDDTVITHYGSMHEALANERKVAKKEYKKLRALPERTKEQEARLLIVRNEIKHQKFENVSCREQCAHTENTNSLVNREGNSLFKQFSLFAEKAFRKKSDHNVCHMEPSKVFSV